jgi:hypothetical protein
MIVKARWRNREMVDLSTSTAGAVISALRLSLSALLNVFSWRRPRLAIHLQTKRGCRPRDGEGIVYIRLTNKSARAVSVRAYCVDWIDINKWVPLRSTNFDEYVPGSAKNLFGSVIGAGECREIRIKLFPEWTDEFYLRDPLRIRVYADGYGKPAELLWRWSGK